MKIFEYTSIALALITVILAIFFDRLEIDLSAPWQQVVGNIHPLLLHLPIGGLTIVLLIEIARKKSWIKADESLLYLYSSSRASLQVPHFSPGSHYLCKVVTPANCSTTIYGVQPYTSAF